jgi:hypothetical protein
MNFTLPHGGVFILVQECALLGAINANVVREKSGL